MNPAVEFATLSQWVTIVLALSLAPGSWRAVPLCWGPRPGGVTVGVLGALIGVEWSLALSAAAAGDQGPGRGLRQQREGGDRQAHGGRPMTGGDVPARAPSEAEVIGYLKTLSNWGRWGTDDELGTLNLITPAKRIAAARPAATTVVGSRYFTGAVWGWSFSAM